MGRPKKTEPTYLRHKGPDGKIRARTVIDGKTHYLGEYGSEESLAEFARLKAEAKARQGANRAPALPTPAGVRVRTVDDLIDLFWVHAEQHYRKPDGRPTTEIDGFRQSLRPLRRLYGHTDVRQFGPVALEAVQQAMVTGNWMTDEERAAYAEGGRPIGLARKVVNQRVGRIRRVLKWGARKQLIPFAVYDSLRTVPGLQLGRTPAREYEDVPPVPSEHVEAVFPHFGPVVGAMVRLQQYTGMRPGEVVQLTPGDIDRQGMVVDGVRVWFYRPGDHKGLWRGHKKVLAIGPKAQTILEAFLDRPADAPCFSPREELEGLRRRAEAASRSPSRRGKNRVASPRLQVRDHYTVDTYGKRVRLTCRRRQLPEWHPHQLRHLVGTEVENEFGLDAARAVLDHKDPKVTLLYAQRSLKKAAEIVAKIG